MNEEQKQTLLFLLPLIIELATLATVVVGFLYNDCRLNDLRDVLRSEIRRGVTLRVQS